jgi:hypothetical protein
MKESPIVSFTKDYIERHKHPTNALLHIIGVPAVFVGLYELLIGHFKNGIMLIFIGYFLQYLGHRAQGNEVGEVTLIKNIWRRVTERGTKFW